MHCITTVLFGVALHCVEAFAAAEPLHLPQVRIYQTTWVHTMVMITMIVMIVTIIMITMMVTLITADIKGWSCDF